MGRVTLLIYNHAICKEILTPIDSTSSFNLGELIIFLRVLRVRGLVSRISEKRAEIWREERKVWRHSTRSRRTAARDRRPGDTEDRSALLRLKLLIFRHLAVRNNDLHSTSDTSNPMRTLRMLRNLRLSVLSQKFSLLRLTAAQDQNLGSCRTWHQVLQTSAAHFNSAGERKPNMFCRMTGLWVIRSTAATSVFTIPSVGLLVEESFILL